MTKPAHTKELASALIVACGVFALSLLFFNTTQSTLLALIALLVVLWTNEALPLAVVSLLPIVLFPAFGVLNTAATAHNYANPIIFLFLGGFLIAIAFEKTHLHLWITKKMLRVFPATPRGIIFSLVITAGVLSSILSNTTTALLLIPIALFITEDTNLKMRFALAIAYGTSVGGILTPIGTPPNLIMLGVMQEKGMEAIPFFQWMWMSAPLVALMMACVGFVLSYGVSKEPLRVEANEEALSANQKKILLLLGALIVLLLLNAPIKPYWSGLGMSESAILLGAGLLLFMPPFGILDWMEDKGKIPFRIMFLFGAGFAIAKAFSATLLADEVASHLLKMSDFTPFILLACIAFLITFTTEITSNTALISIMLPVVYALSLQMELDTTLFMMVATICASYAFMLPIATPPNAIAMSSGVVEVKTMMRYGLFLNIAGIVLIVLLGEFFWSQVL